MKFIFNHLSNKIAIFIILSNLFFGLFVVYISSEHLLEIYEDEINIKINERINVERLNFESQLIKIEAAVDVLRHTIASLYTYSESMDILENQVLALLTNYLQSENPVSYSMYVYFDPDIDGNPYDVWLTNEANGIMRHEKIPLDRYKDRDNMDWFYDVKSKFDDKWIPPYRNRFNQYITSYVMPITNDDAFIGIIGMYLDLNHIENQLAPLNTEQFVDYWILNEYDEIVYHPSFVEGVSLEESGYHFNQTEFDYYLDERNNVKLRHYVSKTHNGWQFIYTIRESNIHEEKNELLINFIYSAVIFLSIIQIIIFIISRKYHKMLSEIRDALKASRRGDFERKIHIHTRDEFGQFSHDINETNIRMKRLKIELEKNAYISKNTLLPNWDKLEVDLKTFVHENDVVMYLIDLDDFKHINDLIGRSRSDNLIKEIAQKLKELETTNFLLYNVKADVFAFIELSDDYGRINEQANSILKVFEDFTYSANYNFSMSCSIGIAKYPDDAIDAYELLACSKIALEEAKLSGKSTFRIYSRFRSSASPDLDELDHELQRALKNNEFVLHYQCRYDHNQVLVGLESLIRWEHPTKGLLYPSYFLKFAEQSGFINQIGEFVITQILKDSKKLEAAKIFLNTISINISTRQLLSPLLISSILGILRKQTQKTDHIEIEIKEDMLYYDREKSLKKLNALQVAGVKIAIDNFGLQEASFKNLLLLPLHRIKLSRTLIEDIDNKITLKLLKNIVQIANLSKLQVTSEGIENKKQFDILNKLNINEFQGYYFHKPSDLESIIKTYKK